VMDDSLAAGTRYALTSSSTGPRPDLGDWLWDEDRLPEPAASKINWSSGNSWGPLSPFQGSSKPGRGAAQNVSDFLFRFR